MISVCIPTYEQYGMGPTYLAELLNSLVIQNIVFEVIVSDNSDDNTIKEVVETFKNKMDISYYHNPVKGISHNTNNAISKAKYKKIKPMYQDDRLNYNGALKLFSEALDTKQWVICNSMIIHAGGGRAGAKNAYWHECINEGTNTIGMPSVMAYNKTDITFNPKLHTMLDCHFYTQLFEKYGLPAHIKQRIVDQRYHDNSASRKEKNTKEEDIEYLTTINK
jgi:glycosyltransferase involved in cell wall biosynthesis